MGRGARSSSAHLSQPSQPSPRLLDEGLGVLAPPGRAHCPADCGKGQEAGPEAGRGSCWLGRWVGEGLPGWGSSTAGKGLGFQVVVLSAQVIPVPENSTSGAGPGGWVSLPQAVVQSQSPAGVLLAPSLGKYSPSQEDSPRGVCPGSTFGWTSHQDPSKRVRHSSPHAGNLNTSKGTQESVSLRGWIHFVPLVLPRPNLTQAPIFPQVCP